MTARKKVYVGLFVLAGLGLLLLGGAFYVESIGVRSPEAGDTISELAKEVWAFEPWVVWVASHMVAMPVWFLAGHFFGAPKSEYDAIRRRAMSLDKLLAEERKIMEEIRLRNLAR